jgi:hypothetical protein
MKAKPLLIALFLCVSATLYAPSDKSLVLIASEPCNPYESILTAIAEIESNNNPMAYNPIEMAPGKFQIRPIRLLDYNNRSGEHLTLNDCFDAEVSRRVILFYISKYHPDDVLGMARCWNGKSLNNEYYHKITTKLKTK